MRGVGEAWLVSPELRAPFPAALCYGASGPERRRAYLEQHAPAPRLMPAGPAVNLARPVFGFYRNVTRVVCPHEHC